MTTTTASAIASAQITAAAMTTAAAVNRRAAAALGATGAVIGFVLGIGIAVWIGRANFHAPVAPRFSVLPFILAGSIVLTMLSAILPISLLRRVQPAVILRGE